MAELMVEHSWWSGPDAAQERRALIAAFRVEALEAATADLRARCERLERPRSAGESVTVGEVAEVLLSQWSVAFHTRLADSQRAFFAVADHDRLARAAEDGRAAAVAVRDRYLTPQRISGHSLQRALNLAGEDASRLRPDRSDTRQLRPEPSEAAKEVSAAHDATQWRRAVVEGADVSSGLLAADRASVCARIVAIKRVHAAVEDQSPITDRSITRTAAERRDRAGGRGMSM